MPKDLEVEVKIPERPPKLYELVQLSQDESFDLDDIQPTGGFCDRLCFERSPGGSVVACLLATPRVSGLIPTGSRIFH